jgi:hypothetical protein
MVIKPVSVSFLPVHHCLHTGGLHDYFICGCENTCNYANRKSADFAYPLKYSLKIREYLFYWHIMVNLLAKTAITLVRSKQLKIQESVPQQHFVSALQGKPFIVKSALVFLHTGLIIHTCLIVKQPLWQH